MALRRAPRVRVRVCQLMNTDRWMDVWMESLASLVGGEIAQQASS